MFVRSFIAIHVSEKARRKMAAFANGLFAGVRGVKAVEEQNIHLTLKFLGDIKMEKTGAVCDCLEEAAEGIEPFTMEIRGVGAFPRPARPGVVWAGAHEPSGNLLNLHRNIENALAKLGFKKEKKEFTPHLTIGRIRKQEAGRGLADAIIAAKDLSFGEKKVSDFTLMMSELSAKGPTYTTLGTVRLGK
jgi:2'-5' RNA ligase